tara:strand:+ start:5978 stop:6754 length:777 start_codon:yes stop_codon:yes gene_type:complete
MGMSGGGDSGSAALAEAKQMEMQAYRDSVLENQRQYDYNRELLQPYRENSESALNQQMAMSGMLGEGSQQSALDAMGNVPGSQFGLEQLQEGLLASAAATGGLGGGNVQRDLAEMAVNYGIGQQSNYYNQLANISGTGASTNQTLSGLGINTAQTNANTMAQLGQNQSGYTLGEQQMNASQQQSNMNTLGAMGGSLAGYFGSTSGGNKKSDDGSNGTIYSDWQGAPNTYSDSQFQQDTMGNMFPAFTTALGGGSYWGT